MALRALAFLLATGTPACAGGSGSVSPADVPRLQAAVADNPQDGATTLRLAAAMQAAGDCDGAIETARRGMELRPQDALGPLVVGECLEGREEASEAVEVYESFAASYPNALGTSAVAAHAMLARRGMAAEEARELLANETSLATGEADRNVLAVMPIEIIGDESYAPLSLGLASMITSDLALVQGFRLVERAQLEALLREIELAESGVVDPATAVRAGRLLRAGTVAHGLTHFAPDERLRMELSLMDPASRIVGSESASGGLRDLFTLEKQVVLALIDQMGYPLTQGERNAILENGTRSLAAFLAYSRGLLEQEAGNYAAASREFAAAVRADPGFQQARDAHQLSSGAAAVQAAGSGGATALAGTPVSNPTTPTASATASAALSASVTDLAPTLAETVGGTSTGTRAASTSTSIAPVTISGTLAQIVTFGFHIVLRLP